MPTVMNEIEWACMRVNFQYSTRNINRQLKSVAYQKCSCHYTNSMYKMSLVNSSFDECDDDYALALTSNSTSTRSGWRPAAAGVVDVGWWRALSFTSECRAMRLARPAAAAADGLSTLSSALPDWNSAPHSRQSSSRLKFLRNGSDKNAYRIGLTQLFMYDKQLAKILNEMTTHSLPGPSYFAHCWAMNTTFTRSNRLTSSTAY